MGRWEWIILLLGFLALLVWELIRTRRAIAAAQESKPKPPTNGS